MRKIEGGVKVDFCIYFLYDYIMNILIKYVLYFQFENKIIYKFFVFYCLYNIEILFIQLVIIIL